VSEFPHATTASAASTRGAVQRRVMPRGYPVDPVGTHRGRVASMRSR
jgi:hypothetical protein